MQLVAYSNPVILARVDITDLMPNSLYKMTIFSEFYKYPAVSVTTNKSSEQLHARFGMKKNSTGVFILPSTLTMDQIDGQLRALSHEIDNRVIVITNTLCPMKEVSLTEYF